MTTTAPSPAKTEFDHVIMTVAGPLAPTDVPSGPVLCREWLLSDQSTLTRRDHQDGRPRELDRVQLASMTSFRRWPLHALHNLSLAKEDILSELFGPIKHIGTLVVISTPRPFWGQATCRERGAALKALHEETGVHIIAGTLPVPAPLGSPQDFEVEVSRLVSDLAVGFEGHSNEIRPGLIGEMPFSSNCDGPAASAELLTLRVCVEAQRRTGAPLLMSGPVSQEILSVLDGTYDNSSGPCVWEHCAFFDVPSDSPVPPATLSARGAFLGFCPPPGCADIAWESYPYQRPWRTEEKFIRAICDVPEGRALLSSGLRFKTDVASYGGAGLGYAPDLLTKHNYQHRLADTRHAAIEFLKYPWKPPAPPEEVVNYIWCHWCGEKKKIGDHFSKMNFDYCSPKCISKHRQADFDPTKRGTGN